MHCDKTRLAPLVLILPLIACSIFERTPATTPAPLPTEVPPLEHTPLPPPSEAPPVIPPTIEIPTLGPVTGDWPCYSNESAFPFTVCYPPDATVEETPPDSARIDLPVAPDTNLVEKWVDVLVFSGQTECHGPQGSGATSEVVTVAGPYNSLDFVRETGGDAGMGNYYEWVSYSTSWGDTCASLTFTLHSTNPLFYDPPIAEFDRDAETAVFDEILATFYWWG
jgi:hypothetical protein